jgi:hypothetical protein
MRSAVRMHPNRDKTRGEFIGESRGAPSHRRGTGRSSKICWSCISTTSVSSTRSTSDQTENSAARIFRCIWVEPGVIPFSADRWRSRGLRAGKFHRSRCYQAVWDVAEFFVLRGMRRGGVGTESAQEVWAMFPVARKARVMQANQRAAQLWPNAITEHTGEPVQPPRSKKTASLGMFSLWIANRIKQVVFFE